MPDIAPALRPSPEVMQSTDSTIWADAFIAAAQKQPARLLDRPMVEQWMRAAIAAGYLAAGRSRAG